MMAPRPRRICSLGRIDFRAKVTRNFFLFQNQEEVERSRWKSRKKNREQRKNVEGLLRKNLSLLLSFSHSLTHPHALTHTHSLFLSLTHSPVPLSHTHTHSLSLPLPLSYSHSPMLTHTQPSACMRAHTLSLFALALRMETQIDYDSKQK